MTAYAAILGQHYQTALNACPELTRLAIDDNLTGSEQDFYLSTQDGAIECSLDEQGIVTTLFVQFHLGAPEVMDIHPQTSLTSLVQRFGPPIAKGRGRRSDVFGNIGGWVKFTAGQWFIHLEFDAVSPRFKMMTVMSKNVA